MGNFVPPIRLCLPCTGIEQPHDGARTSIQLEFALARGVKLAVAYVTTNVMSAVNDRYFSHGMFEQARKQDVHSTEHTGSLRQQGVLLCTALCLPSKLDKRALQLENHHLDKGSEPFLSACPSAYHL